eukprot:s2933_g3.t1
MWLLLLFCAASLAKCLLRILPPHLIRQTTPLRMTPQLPGVWLRCLSTAPRPCPVAAFGVPKCPSVSVDLAFAPPNILPIISARVPAAAARVLRALSGEEPLPSTHDDVSICAVPSSTCYYVLLLRRLRMPLLLAPQRCSCHGQLHPHTDHPVAVSCPQVLLEHTVARVCREAGARVARHVCLAKMNPDVPIADERRIEVVAKGLLLGHGSQLAVDATIVSPLTRHQGEAHPRADVQPGCAVTNAARHKRHNNLATPDAAIWLPSGLKSVAGLAARPCSTCAFLQATGPLLSRACCCLRAMTAWVTRESGLLAVAAQRAFAASLLEIPSPLSLEISQSLTCTSSLPTTCWDPAYCSFSAARCCADPAPQLHRDPRRGHACG